MEEAQEILLNSLANSGVSLPEEASSIKNLTPNALVSICARSLRLIDESLSFPSSLPDSMADRFKICSEISSSIKGLGFRGEISFHQFLYPSEEESFKLVRFLVERLSQTSEGGKVNGKEVDARLTTERTTDCIEKSRLEDLAINAMSPDSDHVAEIVSTSGQQAAEPVIVPISGSLESTSKEEEKDGKFNITVEPGNEESTSQGKGLHVKDLKQKLASLRERSLKIRNKMESLQSQEKMLTKESTSKALEAQQLERKHDLLNAAAEMAFDDQHPLDFYIEDLNKKVEAGRRNLMDLESTRNASTESPEENNRSLEQKAELRKKPHNVKEIELETEAILLEIRKREEEHSKLSSELEKQPKVASRKSYVQRVTEITKNSRKQDADIERILKDTRELQLESNSIQERLHRTYAVVDETMYRDVKKDPVRLQAHKLLTSIHESFEQISKKILATDRIRREIAEQEAKLASVATRNVDANKLQRDLDAIRRENEFLEQQLNHLLVL